MRQNIVRLRKARKLTKYRLAKQADISRAYLGAIEAGKSDPSISTLAKIAAALEVPLTELVK
jgi:transcriptional regulator with XRE-family HTH domain